MRLRVEFGLEIWIFRAAGSRAVRAAGLGHEAVDDAVKRDPVVKALRHELLDMRNVIGREIGPELYDDRTLGGLQRHGVSVGHGVLLLHLSLEGEAGRRD